VGAVSGVEVKLSRARQFSSNIFKPFFYGKFVTSNGRTTLIGKFVMHPLIMLGLLFFYCAFTIISVLFFLAWFGNPSAFPEGYPLYGPGVLVLFTGFVWFVRWTSKDDVSWISTHIRDALAE
jgi:hypothetical protein